MSRACSGSSLFLPMLYGERPAGRQGGARLCGARLRGGLAAQGRNLCVLLRRQPCKFGHSLRGADLKPGDKETVRV